MKPDDIEAELEAVVRAEAEGVVAAGAASIDVADQSSLGGPCRVITVTPTRTSACPVTELAQSDREISFFVGPPSYPDAMTVDLWDRDRAALFDRVRAYLRAIFVGRVTVEARPPSSAGRGDLAARRR